MGYPQANQRWMWGALLAVSIACCLHQLTTTPDPPPRWPVTRVRDDQAMIATLRHRLIWRTRTPGPPSGALTPAYHPGHHLLAEVLTRLRALPATP